MTVREYIGARYVPLFMGEWSDQNAYEPLSIVVNQGNSYTSRQAVPVGIPITNEQYWALTGNYNAQVEQYRQEVSTVRDGIGDGFTSENTIADTLDGFSASNPVKQYVDAATEAIADTLDGFSASNPVKQYVDAATGSIAESIERKAVYIGNSYVEGYGGNNHGIFYNTKDMFDDAWKFTGSGSGFVFTDTPFFALLQQASASADFDNSEITDIIFVCAAGEMVAFTTTYGGNSTTYTSAVNSTVEQIMTYIKTNFPNVKRVVCTLAESQQYPVCNTSNTYIPYFVSMMVNQALRAVCNKNGIDYLGWIGWEIDVMPALFYDSIHPNENGYIRLSNAFMEAWDGNYEPTKFHSRLDLNCFLTEQSACMVTMSQTPENAEFVFNTSVSNKGQGVTPTSTNNWHDWFTIGSDNTVTNRILIPLNIKSVGNANFNQQKIANLLVLPDITSVGSALPIYLRMEYYTDTHEIKIRFRVWKDIPAGVSGYTDDMGVVPNVFNLPCPGVYTL